MVRVEINHSFDNDASLVSYVFCALTTNIFVANSNATNDCQQLIKIVSICRLIEVWCNILIVGMCY